MSTINSSPTPDELLPTLCKVRASIELVNKSMILAEAVRGVRLVEPRNDLSQELKEINWLIARLSGSTWMAEPPVQEAIELPAEPRRTGICPDGRQA